MSPVQMPVHRVPVANQGEGCSSKLRGGGNYCKVHKPTPWSTNELIRETPKKFRLCIDSSQTVNKAILRPVFQRSTQNEQLHRLVNAKCFCLVDIREGFLHCPLDTQSSMMTTMHTSCGRYRWVRLPFGISSAPEEFQLRLTISVLLPNLF